MSPDPEPSRRMQFSLRDVAIVVLAVCFWLAMLMQFGFIGFVIGGYMAGIVLGWRFRWLRLRAASLAGLVVLIATLFACWRSMGTPGGLHSQDFKMLERDLIKTNQALESYRKQSGALPEKLEALRSENWQHDDSLYEFDIVDPWLMSFEYEPFPDGTFVLFSLGLDHQPDGDDLNADISLANLAAVRDKRLSWSTFSQTSEFHQVLMAAMLASALAAMTGIQFPPASGWQLVIELAVIIAFTTVVAVFLAFIYVAVGQSGH